MTSDNIPLRDEELIDPGDMNAASLVAEGTRLVRGYMALQDKGRNLAKRLGLTVLRLRAVHQDANGRPDLTGRSKEYREAIEKLYADAGVPSDSAESVQSLVRYYVSNLRVDYMRANGYTEEDFRYYGLKDRSKRESQKERRRVKEAERRALLADLTLDKAHPAESSGRLVARLAETGEQVADPEVLASLPTLVGEEREEMVRSLNRLDELVAMVRASL